MNSHTTTSERRAFGRRESCLHGMARLANRQPEPCIVRNFSDGGALLEFNTELNPPFRFRLIVEPKEIDTTCEVRHRKGRYIGVRFLEAGAVVAERLEPLPSMLGTEGPPQPAPAPLVRARPMLCVSGRALREKMFGHVA